MKQSPDSAKEVAQQVRGYRKRYERVKARLCELDFIVRGSFVRQRLPCGNPNCRCHKNARLCLCTWLQWLDGGGKYISRRALEPSA